MPDPSMVQVDEQLESVWPSAVALLCVLLAGSYVLFKPFGKQTDSHRDEAAPTANEPHEGHVPVKPKGRQHKVKKKAAAATASQRPL